MKDLLINSIMNKIIKYNNYDDSKIKIIRYGLSSLYLQITKIIVIFVLAYYMKLLKTLLIFMLFYSILRLTGFGVHAKKSIHCWIASLTSFILIPYLCEALVINNYIKIFISIICLLLITIYAPADTEKRPLYNKKKRTIYKLITIINCIIYIFIISLYKNNIIDNCILFSIIFETLLILPITYKLFKVNYGNYKNTKGDKK